MEKYSGSIPFTKQIELMKKTEYDTTQKTNDTENMDIDVVRKHGTSLQTKENKHSGTDEAKGDSDIENQNQIKKYVNENTDEHKVEFTKKFEVNNGVHIIKSDVEKQEEEETDKLMDKGGEKGGRDDGGTGEEGGREGSGRGEKTIPPDGGWGWVVLAASFIVMVSSSIGPCFALVFSPLFSDLGTPPSTVSLIFNFFSLVWNFTSPVVGALTKEFGHRRVAVVGSICISLSLLLSAFAKKSWVLCFSFSLLAGIGLGMLVTISNIIIPVYFTNHLGRANGILMTGGSIGMFLLPHLITFLQDVYAYKGSMLILAAIFLNTCLAVSVYHPVWWHSKTVICQGNYSSKMDVQLNQSPRKGPPEDKNLLENQRRPSAPAVETPEQPHTQSKSCGLCYLLLRVCKSTILSLRILCLPPAFIIALSGCLIWSSYLNFIMMVPFVAQKFISVQGSALCVSIAGILITVSSLITSALTDFKWLDLRVGYIVSILVMAVSNVAFPYLTTLRAMAITMGFWGYGIGSFLGLYNLVMVKYIGVKNLPAMYGACSVLNALGFICVGPMLGRITEVVGDYSVSIFVLAAIECLCVILWLLMPAAVAWQKRSFGSSEAISV